jgi:hypothetical protein
MATATKPAATTETVEKKKRGVAKGTKRPSKFASFTVKYAIAAVDFKPLDALTALANSLNLHVANVTSKNRAGEETGKQTLVVSTTVIAKRAKAIMSKDAEKSALAAFRAAMRDPEKAPKIQALVEKSNAGQDTSAEMAALIGLSS